MQHDGIQPREPFDRTACNGVRALVAILRLARERARLEHLRKADRDPFVVDELDVLSVTMDGLLDDFARSAELRAQLDGAA